MSVLKGIAYAALLALLALIVAVAVASAYLPSYSDLTKYFNGALDEVAIYSTALTPERIWTHYQTGIRP